ncbi:hypothetical protein CTH30272_01077 [Allocatenococcus thiocycli]|nr:hypothetical protein CTH30272_01077 [Catenococcus thiocycli]
MTRNAVPIGHIGDYEIKQLKIFKVVADCGGFSAAETELNVSRSTISIHISALLRFHESNNINEPIIIT